MTGTDRPVAAGVVVLPDPAAPVELAAVAALELVRVRLPRRRRLRAAHGTTPADRDVVLVRALGTDGREGWGECSALEAPTYTGEHTDGAWAVLGDDLAPAALAGHLDEVGGHPMAATAVEVALVDLALQRQGRSLVDALGGAHGGPITWTVVAGIHDSVADLVDELRAVLGDRPDDGTDAAWFPPGAVKLKIEPGWDVEPVEAVRAAWPTWRVQVDANASFTTADLDHLVGLARLLPADAYLEQPLGAADLAGHAALSARLPGRHVALDESIGSVTDLDRAAAAAACSVVNLKPARVGGVRASVAVARAARAATPAVRVFVGGMLETAIGRAVALAVAASRSVGATEVDLGPPSHYFAPGVDLADLVELADQGDTRPADARAERRGDVLVDDGSARPDTGDRGRRPSSSDLVAVLAGRPGIGVAPRPDRLADVVVDRRLIRRA